LTSTKLLDFDFLNYLLVTFQLLAILLSRFNALSVS